MGRSSKKWISKWNNDLYVKLAKERGYRARSAFKLIEIFNIYKRLIRQGYHIVDLGSAPGSWSQVIREKLINSNGILNGRIIALDLLPMSPIVDVEFIQGDFRDILTLKNLESILKDKLLDLIVSDMSHNLSGFKSADSIQNQYICELVVKFALSYLNPHGSLIVKAFHGSGFSQIVQLFKQYFKYVTEHKPKASRSKSSETFLIAYNFK